MPWQITFHAYGDQFRPSQIEFPFAEAFDPGTIGKEGRYKDKPLPFGSIRIEVPR